jgi:hypothetical protein
LRFFEYSWSIPAVIFEYSWSIPAALFSKKRVQLLVANGALFSEKISKRVQLEEPVPQFFPGPYHVEGAPRTP